MENEREIESLGNSVEAAIATGLEALGVDRDQVRIQVLDEGSRGLLGIGSRPARVRLIVEGPRAVETPAAREKPAPAAKAREVAPAVEVEPEPELEAPPEEPPSAGSSEEAELRRVAPVARQTLEELLDKMGIEARVEDYIKSPQDPEDYYKLVLNVRGRDLGVLIGRRGETLDALQYITRLIVGREVERRVHLVLDVEDYRLRRERSLYSLAERMAERVVATGHRQVLEPMPPAERRIIHVALRDHPQVETESVGQDENRKVTIFLKESE